MAKTLLTLLGFCILLPSYSQNTYYVATNGNNDNTGTISSPFADLQRAIDLASAGDQIFVRGGLYPITRANWDSDRIGIYIGRNGSNSQPIRIFNYPGETPVFDFSAQDDAYLTGIYISGDYIHLKGLTVRNVPLRERSNSTGIKLVDANHVIIESCITHQIAGSGIRIEGSSSNNYIVNCDSYDNYDPLTGGGNADGFQIAFTPRNSYNYILGCRAWNNSDDGYDLYENEGFMYIAHSWAWNSGYVPGTSTPAGDGSGFKLGRTNESRASGFQRVVFNCIAFNNKQNGFYNNSANVNMLLVNCTSYNNEERGFYFSNTGTRVVNCISYNDDYQVAFNRETIEVNNSWQLDDLTNSDFISMNSAVMSGSRSANGTLPYIEFLRPTDGSYLIDGGEFVSNNYFESVPGKENYDFNVYSGSAPDIGALETESCGPVRLSAEISPATEGNSDGSIDLAVTGSVAPYIYSWSNGSSQQDLESVPAGTYSVTVTSSEECVGTATYEVPELSEGCDMVLNATIRDENEGQQNGAIDLEVSGGTGPYSYNWSNGRTTQDINSLEAGLYRVTVTGADDCEVNGSYTVEEIPAATDCRGFHVGAFVKNANEGVSNGAIDLVVNGGAAPFTYQWSNGATTQDIENLSPGDYSVYVTDANGCVVWDEWRVRQISGTNCSGFYIGATLVNTIEGTNTGSIDLRVTGSVAPYSFEWSNGSTTEDIDNLGPGSYSVVVTSAEGCVTTDNWRIYAVPNPVCESMNVSASVSHSGAGESNGSIDLSVSGVSGPFTYNWSTGASSQDVFGLSAGIYRVTVTSAENCVRQRSYEVLELSGEDCSAFDLVVFVSDEINNNNKGSIDINPVGVSGPFEYLWSTGSTNEDLTNLSAGLYSVTVTSVGNCQLSESFVVENVYQGPDCQGFGFQAFVSDANEGAADGMIDLVVSGGVTPYSFAWSDGSTSEDLTNLSPGYYAVTVSSANGCTLNGSWTVAAIPTGTDCSSFQITAIITDATEGTNDGAIELYATGASAPYVYNWSNGSSSKNLSNIPSGTYTVNVTSNDGCHISGTWIVNEIPVFNQPNNPPEISVSFEKTLFAGMEYTFDAASSVDPDGDPLKFKWILPNGIRASSPDAPATRIIGQQSAATQPRIRLEVSDGSHTVQHTLNLGIETYRPEMTRLQIAGIEASDYEHRFYPENVLDGNSQTYWMTEGSNQWILLELPYPINLSHLRISFFNGEYRRSHFDLFASEDNLNWKVAGLNLISSGLSDWEELFILDEVNKIEGIKYLKLQTKDIVSEDLYTISEIGVYGSNVVSSGSLTDHEDAVRLYPTPARETITIEVNEEFELRIYTVQGNLISRQSIHQGMTTLSTPGEPGLYLYEFLGSSGKVEIRKVIVE